MKKYILFSLLLFALAIRIYFIAQTNYTSEDAHITFQFARNIMRGDGFSLNPNVPIYGSTTPLLTILLAGWLFVSKDIVSGARLIELLSIVGGMIFFYFALNDKRTAVIALFIIALSSRLYVEEMQGMEIPMLFLFMAMSLYGFMRKKPVLAGVAAGLMLWTRVDAVIWVGCLFIAYLLIDRRKGFQYFIVTCMVYMPWILFSWLYFGSPIPFTIIAKQVAYGIGNPPYIVHMRRIVEYMGFPVFAFAIFSIYSIRKEKYYWIFPLFVLVEFSELILFGSTFFPRYFYLLTLVCYILLAFGVARLIVKINYITPVIFLAILLFSFPGIQKSISDYKYLQSVRQGVLTQMGQWINENTPKNSTILLEPLGYVGWYADRIMYDEVGLVTPLVVELHRNLIPGAEFYRYFNPDYVIWTCGEGGKSRTDIIKYYNIAKVFDGHSSRSCYEIWHKIGR